MQRAGRCARAGSRPGRDPGSGSDSGAGSRAGRHAGAGSGSGADPGSDSGAGSRARRRAGPGRAWPPRARRAGAGCSGSGWRRAGRRCCRARFRRDAVRRAVRGVRARVRGARRRRRCGPGRRCGSGGGFPGSSSPEHPARALPVSGVQAPRVPEGASASGRATAQARDETALHRLSRRARRRVHVASLTRAPRPVDGSWLLTYLRGRPLGCSASMAGRSRPRATRSSPRPRRR